MYLAFGTGFGGFVTLREAAAWAANHGFSYIEINVGPTFRGQGPDIVDLSRVVEEGAAEVEEALSYYKVRISAIAPMLNLLDADRSVREERIAYFRLVLDACAALDVPVAKTYAGSAFGMYFYGLPSVGPSHPSNRLEENLAAYEEVFAPLASYAADRGVRIAFETAPRGGGHGNLAHSPYLWERIFEVVPSKAIGLAFDPSHLVWLHCLSAEEAIRAYGERVYYVDGKDTVIMSDRLRQQGFLGNDWWRYCVPGMGELNWAKIIAALQSVGYDYVISVENEDSVYPGLLGTQMAAAFLSPLLPPHDLKS